MYFQCQVVPGRPNSKSGSTLPETANLWNGRNMQLVSTVWRSSSEHNPAVATPDPLCCGLLTHPKRIYDQCEMDEQNAQDQYAGYDRTASLMIEGLNPLQRSFDSFLAGSLSARRRCAVNTTQRGPTAVPPRIFLCRDSLYADRSFMMPISLPRAISCSRSQRWPGSCAIT